MHGLAIRRLCWHYPATSSIHPTGCLQGNLMQVEEFLKKYAQGSRDFKGVNLSEANLSGVNLSGANLSEANLSIANLSGANLSQANLSEAKLNVAKLSGANLTNANLSGAILNVANLVRADLGGADLSEAALIRAELIRAELSGANLSGANLTGADLGEARLRLANLSGANLSEANLRGTCLISASLEQANLHGADLSRADLSGADLRGAEFRQAYLGLANLSGADLSGANLRWADLSGVNLKWANLSEAKLSGANLNGADLSNANLLNTSLVHADLTQANLIRADWVGADLTGATLTGAKLYAVSRFGLKTEGMNCDWVDLSPDGDRTQIYRLTPEEARKFFHQTLPTIRIIVDAPLDQEANFALAAVYYQFAQEYPYLNRPPSVEVGDRRTTITLRIDSDEQLLSTAYVAISPFDDAVPTQANIMNLLGIVQAQNVESLSIQENNQIHKIINELMELLAKLQRNKVLKFFPKTIKKGAFFKSATQTTLINSNDRALNIYHHANFGKKFIIAPLMEGILKKVPVNPNKVTLPPSNVICEFIKSFP